MSCNCEALYVGKTDRYFHLRIRDHVYYSANGKMMSKHLDLYRKFDMSLVYFIPKDPRREDWDKHILRRETTWIERLNATHVPAINEAQSYKPFL